MVGADLFHLARTGLHIGENREVSSREAFWPARRFTHVSTDGCSLSPEKTPVVVRGESFTLHPPF